MHIPDGYLSPSTCAVLTAAVVPFWLKASGRIMNASSEDTRAVGRTALMSSFCFVAMMFNIPLPGGTTGHATGAALAGIILGPMNALLAVSATLAIQAVFFGDGGVLAFGPNCFNIALLAPSLAYAVFRAIGGRTAASRAVAALFAGYLSANASALAAAIELGLQPLLFVDATGQPIYCPFPLALSIPGMMIGHLTLFGIAEAIVTMGALRFIEAHEPSLLPMSRRRAGALWAIMMALVLAVPAGLVATGTAWGEWDEYATGIWTALLGGYGETWFGYTSSALVGALLCAGALLGIAWIVSAVRARKGAAMRPDQGGNLAALASWAAELTEAPPSRLDIDARVVLAVTFLGLVVLNLLTVQTAVVAAAVAPLLLVILPGYRRGDLLRRTASFAPLIGLLFAAPAAFLLPGETVWVLRIIPGNVETSVTDSGIEAAARIFVRAIGCFAWITGAIVMTGAARAQAALRAFGLPSSLVTSISIGMRYAPVIGRTAVEMSHAYASRSPLPPRALKLSQRLGALLRRAMKLADEISAALLSRGHAGLLHAQPSPVLKSRDWLFAAGALVVLAVPIAIQFLRG